MTANYAIISLLASLSSFLYTSPSSPSRENTAKIMTGVSKIIYQRVRALSGYSGVKRKSGDIDCGRTEEATSKIPDPRDPSELLRKLNQENLKLRENLKAVEKTAEVARRNELIATEKIRRLKEKLEETVKATDMANEQFTRSLTKLNQLQSWTENVDDDQVRADMRDLFLSSEDWTKQHFSSGARMPHAKTGEQCDKGCLPKVGWCQIIDTDLIQSQLAEYIAGRILSRSMIAAPENLSPIFDELDRYIERSCKFQSKDTP